MTYLADDVLTRVDRTSMAASIEVRLPLLDHTLFEFSAAVPASLKLKHGRRQYLLARVYMPGLWWMLGLTALLGQAAFWGGLAALAFCDFGRWSTLVVALVGGLYLSESARAVLRQRTAALRFPLRRRGARLAALLDIVAHPLLNLGQLAVIASSCGNEVTWRGIRYRLHGPHRTEVLSRPAADGSRNVAAAA